MKPLTAQQEAFAQAVAAGKSQSDAYRHAYPKSVKWKPEALYPQASRAMDDPKIAARIAELRGKAVERHMITVDDLIAELEEVRDMALKSGQASAGVSATMGKAKLLGYGLEKVSVTGPGGGPLQVLGGQLPAEAVSALRERLKRVGQSKD